MLLYTIRSRCYNIIVAQQETPVRDYGVYYIFVQPGAVAMYPMTLFDGVCPDGPGASNPSSLFFIENDITSIEEIEMQLQVSLYSLLKGNITEQLLDETFVLNP